MASARKSARTPPDTLTRCSSKDVFMQNGNTISFMSSAKQNPGTLGLHKRYWENYWSNLDLWKHTVLIDEAVPYLANLTLWHLTHLQFLNDDSLYCHRPHTLCTDCFSPWLLLIFNTLLVCSTNQPNQTYYNPHSTRFIPSTKPSLTILVLRNTNHPLPHLASCKLIYRLFCTMCSIVLMVYMDSPIQL